MLICLCRLFKFYLQYFLNVNWFNDCLVDKDSGNLFVPMNWKWKNFIRNVEGPMCFQFLCNENIAIASFEKGKKRMQFDSERLI